jgi:hypothetical protein
VKKLLLASVLAIASVASPGVANPAKGFDWKKYCSYDCDVRGDRGFEPPSQAQLRACTKNGKLDYTCLRDSYWGKLTNYKLCFREEGGKLEGDDWPQCDPSFLGAIERRCVKQNFGQNRTLELKEQWAKYHSCVAEARTKARRASAEIPAQYRGLWCHTLKGPFYYYRCREANAEGYLQINRRHHLHLGEDDSGYDDCDLIAIKPNAKGHRLYVACEKGPADVDLRLDSRGHLHINDREDEPEESRKGYYTPPPLPPECPCRC